MIFNLAAVVASVVVVGAILFVIIGILLMNARSPIVPIAVWMSLTLLVGRAAWEAPGAALIGVAIVLAILFLVINVPLIRRALRL